MQYSFDLSASKPIDFRDSKWAMGRDGSEVRNISISRERDCSPMMVYAVHHELKLMRFAWQNLQANTLILQTERMNSKIASQRYSKTLKMKALRSIHTYFLNHFGHKNSKQQADTLYRFMVSRKFLTQWVKEWESNINYYQKI